MMNTQFYSLPIKLLIPFYQQGNQQSGSGNQNQQGQQGQQGNQEKCSKEGFMPNKEDCSKFYRCVDNGKGGFTKYEFTCGPGTVWDQEILGCNYPSSSNSGGCKTVATTEQPSSTTGKSFNIFANNQRPQKHKKIVKLISKLGAHRLITNNRCYHRNITNYAINWSIANNPIQQFTTNNKRITVWANNGKTIWFNKQ